MANEQNLKPRQLTNEEATKIGSKGGKKSAEAKRQRKAMREQMECLLSLPLKDKKVVAKFKQIGLKGDNMNNQMALIVAMYQKALKGDTQAFNAIREVVGERVQEIKVNASIDDKVKELNEILDKIDE